MRNGEVFSRRGLESIAHRNSWELVLESVYSPTAVDGAGVELEFALIVDANWVVEMNTQTGGAALVPRARVMRVFTPINPETWVQLPVDAFASLVDEVEERTRNEMTELEEAI